MTAAWAGIVCFQPPCAGIYLGKATYNYGNIMAKQAFTINVPSAAHVKEADYCGMASGKAGNKFSAAGLTPVKSDLVEVPCLQEFLLILACRVIHTLEIGLHTQFIGEILDVKKEFGWIFRIKARSEF